ncbi:hypothetical protein DRI50_07780 [candidate division KSB1 bacterium]|nr:MAG: hypothetical protein DRI50_07780 [candidate division KSB1 bacterium]
MFGCGGWYGSLFGLLFLGLVVWLVIYLINQARIRNDAISTDGQQGSAMEILKKRYARGEISKDEFERMKEQIL